MHLGKSQSECLYLFIAITSVFIAITSVLASQAYWSGRWSLNCFQSKQHFVLNKHVQEKQRDEKQFQIEVLFYGRHKKWTKESFDSKVP